MNRNYDKGRNSYTHVTYRKNPGYFERMGASCGGIVIGVVTIVLAFPLLFLNEVSFC